jgi:hypothetical protein
MEAEVPTETKAEVETKAEGEKEAEGETVFTLAEVEKHTDAESCWIVIDGKVCTRNLHTTGKLLGSASPSVQTLAPKRVGGSAPERKI